MRSPASRAPLVTPTAQSRRRATLVAISALLLLSTTPVFGHHLPMDTTALLAGVDHLGTLCLSALHILLAPVHWGFHLAILGGLGYASWNRYRAWTLVRRCLSPLDIRRAVRGDTFWAAARHAGVDPAVLRIVDGLPNPAFTTGLLAPRIYLSAALAGYLEPEELAAVIAHEGAHVARRDPLRLSVLRALACALFWIPALRRLSDDVTDEAEILADDRAAGSQPLVLASAILRLASWPNPMAGSTVAVGFSGRDPLERRIRRLAGEEVPIRSHLTRRSVAGAAAALVIVWTSGVLMAHPLPAHATELQERHCDHRDSSALTHLFCLGAPFTQSSSDCPHRHG